MIKEQFIALGLNEDQATKAAAESANELKAYIPKHRFDEVNDENKTLKVTVKSNETALEDLKKSTGDSEALKKQIEALQTDNKTKDDKYQADLKELRLTNAIKLAVTGKAHDEDLVAGLFDKSKLILGEDGKITGLDEQLKGLTESKKFLFKEEQAPPTGFHKVGADGKPLPGEESKAPSIKDALTAHFQTQTK